MSRKRRRREPPEPGPLTPTEHAEPFHHEPKVPVPLPDKEPATTELAAAPGHVLQHARQELTEGRVPVRRETRPTYSQWDKEELLILVSTGVSVANATAAVGCSRRTFYRWLAEDPVFRKRYHQDRTRAETDPLEMIREHAKHNLNAAVYLHKNAVRRQRLLERAGQEPAEKKLGQLHIALVKLFGDLTPLVSALDEDHRKSFQQVLTAHIDIFNNVLDGLWRADEEEIVKRDPIWAETPTHLNQTT